MLPALLARLNKPETIVILGRAHGGTRILPEVLIRAGVFMGEPLNRANDLVPVQPHYEACRMFGRYVEYRGKNAWDFDKAATAAIPTRFVELLAQYLKTLLNTEADHVGWKIPQNTLIYPWLVRLLPNATYINWVRHPAGSCGTMTGVDRLERWKIPCRRFLFHEWNYKMRLLSWKYHFDIVEQTPEPANFLTMRFEDYVLHQLQHKERIERQTGLTLDVLKLDAEKAIVPRKRVSDVLPAIRPAMESLGYN